MIVKCEYCGAAEQVPDSYAGAILECECGAEVKVPQRSISKIVIHGPVETYLLSPAITILADGKKLGKVDFRSTAELTIDKKHTLEFRCLGRHACIDVEPDSKEQHLVLSLDRLSGKMSVYRAEKDNWRQQEQMIMSHSNSQLFIIAALVFILFIVFGC